MHPLDKNNAETHQNLTSHSLMNSPAREESSSLESGALDLGDCIGAESCVDLKADLSDLEQEILAARRHYKSRRDNGLGRTKRGKTVKEYPPPIHWLARTENLPSHMPWVMKRYHTADGRLIIREEKVERHEYFQAHRSDGRLTLRLVPLTDDVSYDHHRDDEEENDNANASEDGEVDGFVDVAAEVMAENQTAKEEESLNNSSSESCMEKCGGGARTSCMFGLTLASFRPVRT